MRKLKLILGLATIGLTWSAAQAAQSEPSPSHDTSAHTHRTLAIVYPQDKTVTVKLRGTFRLPHASGEAKVERKRGSTEIEIELDEMKAATHFGGDYNTYILWTVSPEGLIAKAGELLLDGNRSKLNVSSPLDAFAMIVTGEPHYAVSSPSRFIVLENVPPKGRDVSTDVALLRYAGEEDPYRHEQETLKDAPESNGRARTEMGQAQTAIQLAERAGAETFAAAELKRALDLQQRAQTTQAGRGSKNRKEAVRLAREAVRLAAQAQHLSRDRSFDAALAKERSERAEELSRLEKELQSAKTQAERAQLEAQKRTLELQIEAEARQNAEKQVATLRSEQESLLAERQRLQAEAAASAEPTATRAELRDGLSAVAAISETEQGLVVNLPDSLFEPRRAQLKPEAREVLNQIAKVLLANPVPKISIEGHTDDAGSQEQNMKFARERAYAVFAQLAAAGVPGESMAITSFGETAPMMPNSSAGNRRTNRRVEIVLSGVASESARRQP